MGFTLREELCLPQGPPSPLIKGLARPMNQDRATTPTSSPEPPLASSARASTTSPTVSFSLLLRAWLTWFRTRILLLEGFTLLFLLSGRSVSKLLPRWPSRLTSLAPPPPTQSLRTRRPSSGSSSMTMPMTHHSHQDMNGHRRLLINWRFKMEI